MSLASHSHVQPWLHLDSSQRLRLGGVCWILSLAFLVGQAVAQTAWPAYSLLDNHVSDLGNTACGPWMGQAYVCSPLHAVMNASLVLTGVLLLLGLALTRDVWPRRRLTAWGLGLLALAGACTLLVGLSPENVSLPLHLLGALNIPSANLGMLLLGLASRGARPRIATLSILLAGVGLSGLPIGPLLLALTGHGGGLAERIALYPLIAWMVALGIVLLRAPARDARQ